MALETRSYESENKQKLVPGNIYCTHLDFFRIIFDFICLRTMKDT